MAARRGGYIDAVEPVSAVDHAMGVELQIEELMERRTRASVQGRTADAERLQREIAVLQAELAATAEHAVLEGPPADAPPELHAAEQLST